MKQQSIAAVESNNSELVGAVSDWSGREREVAQVFRLHVLGHVQ